MKAELYFPIITYTALENADFLSNVQLHPAAPVLQLQTRVKVPVIKLPPTVKRHSQHYYICPLCTRILR